MIAFYCYLESLNYILPTEASILGSVEPLLAAFLSVIWLKDSFEFADFIGTACIIATIIILSYSNKNIAKDNNKKDTFRITIDLYQKK